MAERDKDRWSSRAKWTGMAFMMLVIVCLAALMAEGVVRARQAMKYGSVAVVEDAYTVDQRSGLRVPRPGKHLSGRVVVNSLGFRGPEITVPKPAGTVRIAFLGASTTWCAEVSSNEHTWPHLVTSELQKQFAARQIDYVNGAVPGYTVASSQANLERRIADLTPDVIVIYHATNDLSGELRDAAVRSGLPYTTDYLRQRSWLAQHSRLWDLAQKNLRIFLAKHAVRRNEARLVVDAKSLGEPFREHLSGLVRAAQRTAKVVALVTFSTQLRAEQDEQRKLTASGSALYYMPFMTPDGLLASYARYNEVIREVAKDTGALLINAERDIPGDPVHFTDTVHFTDAGAARMAERVATGLTADRRIRALAGG